MPLPYPQSRVVSRALRPGIWPISSSRAPCPQRGPPQLPRRFTTSRPFARHDITKAKNHYETLNVPYDASPAEIKKSFYSLSKSHHPDHNPGDASATAKFHSISEAYSVLGTPAKRATYDRDVISRHHGGSGANAQRRGSYHSTGHAGGRPATGLSRRKTQFRGPPPSFHRSGGWGAHSAKRSAAQDDSTGGQSTWTQHAGMGPGQDPFAHAHDGRPGHFDRTSHARTQRAQDHRRAARVLRESGAAAAGAGQDSTLTMFFAVSGVLFLTFFLPFVYFGGLRKDRDKQKIEGKKKTSSA